MWHPKLEGAARGKRCVCGGRRERVGSMGRSKRVCARWNGMGAVARARRWLGVHRIRGHHVCALLHEARDSRPLLVPCGTLQRSLSLRSGGGSGRDSADRRMGVAGACTCRVSIAKAARAGAKDARWWQGRVCGDGARMWWRKRGCGRRREHTRRQTVGRGGGDSLYFSCVLGFDVSTLGKNLVNEANLAEDRRPVQGSRAILRWAGRVSGVG
jgi:hypothetical protein